MISYIFFVQCEILHSVIKMGIDYPITAVKRKQFWNQSCSNLKKKNNNILQKISGIAG